MSPWADIPEQCHQRPPMFISWPIIFYIAIAALGPHPARRRRPLCSVAHRDNSDKEKTIVTEPMPTQLYIIRIC